MSLSIWIVSLLVLGTSANSDDCDGMADQCWARNIRNEGVPATQQEFDDFCEEHINYLECVIEAFSNCKPESDKKLQEYRRVLPLVRNVCDKESDIYNDVVENVQCFHDVTTELSLPCQIMEQDPENTLPKFERVLVSNGVTDVSNLEKCFGHIFFDICELGSAGVHCGSKARDVAVQLTQMFNAAYIHECDDIVKDKLPEVVRAMEVEFRKAQEELERKAAEKRTAQA